MYKYKIVLVLFILIFNSCQESIKSSTNQNSKDSISDFKFTQPQKLISLPLKYRIQNNIFGWSELSSFIEGFENFIKLNQEGNLVFIKELDTKASSLSKSNYPKHLDLPDIRSRLKVVQTFLKQCKFHSENNNWKELDLSLQNLYISYNSFIKRIKSINEEVLLFKE